eukprot:10597142-Ditylum_brightwellii.AAC.2
MPTSDSSIVSTMHHATLPIHPFDPGAPILQDTYHNNKILLFIMHFYPQEYQSLLATDKSNSPISRAKTDTVTQEFDNQ